MIWHVPNDVSTANLDREATLKYFTSENALHEFNSSLREFYTNQFLVQRNLTSIEIEGMYLIFVLFLSGTQISVTIKTGHRFMEIIVVGGKNTRAKYLKSNNIGRNNALVYHLSNAKKIALENLTPKRNRVTNNKFLALTDLFA